MHNNYFFLKKLANELNNELNETYLNSCFSQVKDELLFVFTQKERSFYLKAHLHSDFSSLFFPDQIHRSRKNSVDLFSGVINHKVSEVITLPYDRGFVISFENEKQLLFKMHGNRSNIILFEKGKSKELFHNRQKKDLGITLEEVLSKKEFSLEKVNNYEDLRGNAPFLLGLPEKYLRFKKWIELPEKERKEFLNLLVEHLTHINEYYLIEFDGKIHLSMIEFGDVINNYKSPISAINGFFLYFIKNKQLATQKKHWYQILHKKASRADQYINKSKKRLHALKHDLQYGHLADLLMANLHLVEKGSKFIEVNDFEDPEKKIKISLKPSLTPQKNAENYYRKAKNQGIEIRNLTKNIEEKESELMETHELMEKIQECVDLKRLKSLTAPLSDVINTEEKQGQPLPYHYHEIEGYQVFVGKNAKSNDILLQQHSSKNDLWLHAKDSPGSHVIIRKKGVQNFPKKVIQRAAQLAAFYSKRKGESLCPVSFTEKKYVRKRKGDPAGMVVVQKEDVIMVEPSNLND